MVNVKVARIVNVKHVKFLKTMDEIKLMPRISVFISTAITILFLLSCESKVMCEGLEKELDKKRKLC